MVEENIVKTEIQKAIRDLSEAIGRMKLIYWEEPLLDDAQEALLRLSVRVGRALNIDLQ
ncbi:MAG TPA: hypothetical protein PK358_13850 [Spirochaetota bacterium]|mgnify:CR=1 FL=1|nr:hypothetical protein [Spirochaetota bacterium]HPJ35917.1 hypothetical protein [Spirochaetota bacterium]